MSIKTIIPAREARRIVDNSTNQNNWIEYIDTKIKEAIKKGETDFDIILFNPKLGGYVSKSIRQDILDILKKQEYDVQLLFDDIRTTDWFFRIRY